MFGSFNYKLLGVSFVLLVVGYICLGQGPVNNPLSLSIAPLSWSRSTASFFPLPS